MFSCLLSCSIEHTLCLKQSSLNISLYVSNNQLKPVLTFFVELGTFFWQLWKKGNYLFLRSIGLPHLPLNSHWKISISCLLIIKSALIDKNAKLNTTAKQCWIAWKKMGFKGYILRISRMNVSISTVLYLHNHITKNTKLKLRMT